MRIHFLLHLLIGAVHLMILLEVAGLNLLICVLTSFLFSHNYIYLLFYLKYFFLNASENRVRRTR